MCIGIENHDFSNDEEFLVWKEDKEAGCYTFYTLHDKPYIITADAKGTKHECQYYNKLCI